MDHHSNYSVILLGASASELYLYIYRERERERYWQLELTPLFAISRNLYKSTLTGAFSCGSWVYSYSICWFGLRRFVFLLCCSTVASVWVEFEKFLSFRKQLSPIPTHTLTVFGTLKSVSLLAWVGGYRCINKVPKISGAWRVLHTPFSVFWKLFSSTSVDLSSLLDRS